MSVKSRTCPFNFYTLPLLRSREIVTFCLQGHVLIFSLCVCYQVMNQTSPFHSTEKEVKGSKPEFLKPLKPVSLKEGEDLALIASISGDPEPTVQWMKDGAVMSKDPRTKIEKPFNGDIKLSIDKITTKDAGKYSVTAKNSFGDVQCEAEIKVIPETRYELVSD